MSFLEIQNVSKFYADHAALQDVSLTVPEGSIYGFLGPNGAGKSSMIRIINQITGPDTGRIILNGEPLQQKHIRMIGYLPEERGLYKKMKIGEQITYLAQLKGLSKSDTKEKIKFWFKRFEIEDWWDKKVEELSKGMQQKVQFITTVIHDPKLLILDEPFSGFDPINANIIKDEIMRLQQEGATVLFSTHRMESVEELCDHVALINNSRKILEGKKRDIKKAYKTNVFTLSFKGELPNIPNEKEFIKSEEEEFKAVKIKLLEGQSPNDLLTIILPQVDVNGFFEEVPSMNDIFIKAINESNNG